MTADADLEKLVSSLGEKAQRAADNATRLRTHVKTLDGAVARALSKFYPGTVPGPEFRAGSNAFRVSARKEGDAAGIAIDMRVGAGFVFSGWLIAASLENMAAALPALPGLMQALTNVYDRTVAQSEAHLAGAGINAEGK